MAEVIQVDGHSLIGWPGFHDSFARAFDFPAYYGRNLDAWIDAIEEALSSDRFATSGSKGPLILKITDWQVVQEQGPAQAEGLVSLVDCVNERSLEAGGPVLLALAPVLHEGSAD